MFENGKLSLYKKLKIKNTIDMLIVTIFAIILISVMLIAETPVYPAIIIIALFLTLYVIQAIFLRKWVFSSIQYSFVKDLEMTNDSIINIMDFTTKQRDLLIEYSSAIEDIKSFYYKLKNFASNNKSTAAKMVEKTQQTANYADVGYIGIQNSIEKMGHLKQQTQIIAGLILELSEHIQQIASTINVVEDIAEQTNMLALNTAVEAARAGEHGKGFAVVAGEIRKLADESKQATHKITYLINSIQQVANSTVIATEEGANEIESTVKIVQTLDSTSANLKTHIKDILSNIEDVITQNDTQALSSDEIDSIIKNLEKCTIVSAEMLDRTIGSVNTLNEASESFNKSILENEN